MSGVDPYEDLPPDYRPPQWPEYVLAIAVVVALAGALVMAVVL